jgi:hypothetical protein
VAAVVWKAELLAVVGAEFDSHDVRWWWVVDMKKARPVMAWLSRVMVDEPKLPVTAQDVPL